MTSARMIAPSTVPSTLPTPPNSDVPPIEVVFLDYPDTIMNEYGARGIGEGRLEAGLLARPDRQQGVFELRYFFSESVQGPEGGGTSLLILKRRVKKLIEEEDPSRPLTDEQITRILQSQGIQVTRRTVAKYREDMKIPSTHQRRVKK